MGNLHRALFAVAPGDHQTRGDESLQPGMSLWGQLPPAQHSAQEVAFLVQSHHPQEGAAQGLRLGISKFLRRNHGVRGPRHRALQAAEPLPVGVNSQAAALLPGQLVELAQGEGQERQGVLGLGVDQQRLHQAWLDVEPGESRRLQDDVAQSLDGQGPQREAAEGQVVQRRVPLEGAKVVRA